MPKYIDRKSKQLIKIQEIENKKAKLNRQLIRCKNLSPDEKQLIEFCIKDCDDQIADIKKENMIIKGDCLSCRSMK